MGVGNADDARGALVGGSSRSTDNGSARLDRDFVGEGEAKMGRSVSYRFSVEVVPVSGGHTPAGWRVGRSGQIPGYGKPNAANLKRYVDAFHASLLPGGCNEHLGPNARLVEARIIDHDNNRAIVATWYAPGTPLKLAGRWRGGTTDRY